MENELIRLTLTPFEGYMIGVFIDAFLEQCVANPTEALDPDIAKTHVALSRVRALLPVAR